jgi:hypothetical protein
VAFTDMNFKAVPRSAPTYSPKKSQTVISNNQNLIEFLFKICKQNVKVTGYNKELVHPRKEKGLAKLIDECIEILEDPSRQIIIEPRLASQNKQLFRLYFIWPVKVNSEVHILKRQFAWIKTAKPITPPAGND